MSEKVDPESDEIKDEKMIPGEILPSDQTVEINKNRESTSVIVSNTGDRPAQIGSHFHFFEVNRALEFDREEAFGMRLDIPAGTAVRFEPGEEQEVELVKFAGKKYVTGMNNLTDGTINSDRVKEKAMQKARDQGYKGV